MSGEESGPAVGELATGIAASGTDVGAVRSAAVVAMSAVTTAQSRLGWRLPLGVATPVR
jgi:hypothetical protein